MRLRSFALVASSTLAAAVTLAAASTAHAQVFTETRESGAGLWRATGRGVIVVTTDTPPVCSSSFNRERVLASGGRTFLKAGIPVTAGAPYCLTAWVRWKRDAGSPANTHVEPLHTLFWIAKYIHRVDKVEDLVAKSVITQKEAENFAKAEEFLWTLRCHLHYLAGRPEDRLTFDFQREIARRMGYTDHRGTLGVERLMKHYYLVAKTVGHLTGVFCTALEIETENKPGLLQKLKFANFLKRQQRVDDFVLQHDRLNVADEKAFLADPVNMLRIFRTSHAHGLTIHPAALRPIRQNLRLVDARVRENAEANRMFMEILTGADTERVLRAMNEAGVFGRFVPDFGRVVAQTQHDM